MRGRKYNGYILVEEKALKTRKDLNFWVGQALEFNPRAKASKRA
jgi:hypothetical protein